MKRLLIILCALLAVNGFAAAQYRTQVYDSNIKTLQVLSNNEPLITPIISMNSAEEVVLSFDELSYEVSNFYYKILHCDANWIESDLTSMEYLDGFDGGMIDTYEYSVNTAVNYIHYTLRLPNDNVRLKLSGNYVVKIARGGDFEHGVVATACFSISESLVEVSAEISGSTTKELNGSYQSLVLDIMTNGVASNNKMQDFIVVVRQNNRHDNEVFLFSPTYVNGDRLHYENIEELEFEAGNQYRSVDFSSIHTYGGGIDHIGFENNMHQVVLEPNKARVDNKEAYALDAHGGYLINLQRSVDSEIEADYMMVHFYYLADEPYWGEKIYLLGGLTYNQIGLDSEMQYDMLGRFYYKSLLLKQGGYNYVYGVQTKSSNNISVKKTEGSFWESRNKYDIYVYYRPFGARYDRLVGVESFE
jgi:hypothetical protein